MIQVIKHGDIPKDRLKEVTYTKVVCKVRPQKGYPNRMRITIGGNRIIHPGEIAIPTTSLELVKLIINSVLSRHGAKFLFFGVKTSTWQLQRINRSLLKSKSKIFPKTLFWNIISFCSFTMAGCTSKSSAAVTDSHNLGALPTISYVNASTRPATLKLLPPLASGNTCGGPYNSVS